MTDSISTTSSFLNNILGEWSVSVPEVNNDDVSIMSDAFDVVVNAKEIVRACIITFFPPDEDEKWLLPNTWFKDTMVLRNWCGQFEKGGHTDKLHCHVWCEFKNDSPMRFTALCKLIKEVTGTTGNIKKPKHRLSKKVARL